MPEDSADTSFKTLDQGALSKGVNNEPMKIPDPTPDVIDRTKQVIEEPHPTIGKTIDLTPPPSASGSNLKRASIFAAALAGVAGILGVITHRGGGEAAPDNSAPTTPGDQMIQQRNQAFDAKIGEQPDSNLYPDQKK